MKAIKKEGHPVPPFSEKKYYLLLFLQLGHHFFVDEDTGNADNSHPGKDQDGSQDIPLDERRTDKGGGNHRRDPGEKGKKEKTSHRDGGNPRHIGQHILGGAGDKEQEENQGFQPGGVMQKFVALQFFFADKLGQ